MKDLTTTHLQQLQGGFADEITCYFPRYTKTAFARLSEVTPEVQKAPAENIVHGLAIRTY